jgi:hypothetical protein
MRVDSMIYAKPLIAIRSRTREALLLLCVFAWSSVNAQQMDSASHRSILETLQNHTQENPSVFPLEAYEGGIQSFVDGMRYPYFGYGERKYSHRDDFHPAFDVAYEPMETGDVTTLLGKTRTVRAPQTYLKRVYAIQKGTLYSAALIPSGYKVVLKHTLQEPYFDRKGRPHHNYFTSYRHLDVRSMVYLSLLARRVTNNMTATFEDLIGKHEFESGEIIAFVGFSPANSKTPPRSHLDFSLNLFSKPNTGQYIRDYSMNPLLLFPPFEYADPYSPNAAADGVPVYQFVANADESSTPTKKKDGRIAIEIHAGSTSIDGEFEPRRYFALNAMQITVTNDGEEIGAYVVDRHQKLGYETSSNDRLDNANQKKPHFEAPIGEQGDVFRIDAVIPARWLRKLKYDWSKSGEVTVKISSIWDGYLDGHNMTLVIPLS